MRQNDGYQHRCHNKTLLIVHLIFVTKYRKLVLIEQLAADVKQIIFDTCKKKHWYIRCMETDKDHIHILLQYNPKDSITDIVSMLKQTSTFYIWKHHMSFLKKHYWKEHTLWSDGFFACTVGQIKIQQSIIQKVRGSSCGLLKPTLKGRRFFQKIFYDKQEEKKSKISEKNQHSLLTSANNGVITIIRKRKMKKIRRRLL